MTCCPSLPTVYKPASRTSSIMYTVMFFMFLVSVAATVGSIRNIIVSAKNFEIFG